MHFSTGKRMTRRPRGSMFSSHWRQIDMNTTTHDERPGTTRSRRRARLPAWLRLLVIAGALALAPIGCGKPVQPVGVASAKARAQTSVPRQTSASPSARRPGGVNEATAQFLAFALNALLLPLFDDDLPPRWADPSISFDCDDGAVTIDDAPLDIGAPVPHQAFIVRWHMERCAPFDDAMELTGDVELKVEPSGGGYRAIVEPAQFHVVSTRGHDVLSDPFTARLSVGRRAAATLARRANGRRSGRSRPARLALPAPELLQRLGALLPDPADAAVLVCAHVVLRP